MPITDEMVEAVAKILADIEMSDHRPFYISWSRLDTKSQKRYRTWARKVLEAIAAASILEEASHAG